MVTGAREKVRPSDDSHGEVHVNHTDRGMVDTERKRLGDNRTVLNRSEDRRLSHIDKSRVKSQAAKTDQRTAQGNNRSSHRDQRRLIFLHSRLSELAEHRLRVRLAQFSYFHAIAPQPSRSSRKSTQRYRSTPHKRD